MMSRTWWENEAILGQFREWLAQTGREIDDLEAAEVRESSPADGDGGAEAGLLGEEAPGEPLAEVGLLEVINALTAMRHELKLETKSTRGLEESVKASLAGLDAAARQFQSVKAREKEAADRAALPLVESLVGLDEALLRGERALEATHCQMTGAAPQRLRDRLEEEFARLPWWLRWTARRWREQVHRRAAEALARASADDFARLLEGYRLIQSRIERGLKEYGVRRIETVGRPLDPARMAVVGLVDDPKAEAETVVEEVRPGYVWHDRVIRFAEVRAARNHR